LKYGNCLIYSIYDFVKNGGDFVVSFAGKRQHIPHFAIQRGSNVYDFEIIRMYLYIFLYCGEERITDAKYYDNLTHCKRFLLARRRRWKRTK